MPRTVHAARRTECSLPPTLHTCRRHAVLVRRSRAWRRPKRAQLRRSLSTTCLRRSPPTPRAALCHRCRCHRSDTQCSRACRAQRAVGRISSMMTMTTTQKTSGTNRAKRMSNNRAVAYRAVICIPRGKAVLQVSHRSGEPVYNLAGAKGTLCFYSLVGCSDVQSRGTSICRFFSCRGTLL